MHKHYLIAAHQSPEQLARLVRAIEGADVDVWVHIDAKARLRDFRAELTDLSVHWIQPQIDCVWGAFTQVEVTLALLRAALTSGTPGYILFGSGQDYPIVSNETIDTYLDAHRHVVHMDSAPIDQMWPDQYQVKVDAYTVPLSATRADLRSLPPLGSMTLRGNLGWGRKLVRTFGLMEGARHWRRMQPPRRLPFGLPFGGSSWWGMPWGVAVAMMEWIDTRPEYARYFTYSQCSDEMYFHTALAHLQADGQVTERRPNLTYIDWSGATAGSPKTLTMTDLPTLVNQPDHKLFARKFDVGIDAEVLDALDRRTGRTS